MQEAFELLSDDVFRRSYDSSLPFDDSLPTENEVRDGDFFSIFTPVFQRNEMWSTLQPVPELGNADTPLEQVNRFYAFWSGFESWREASATWKEENG